MKRINLIVDFTYKKDINKKTFIDKKQKDVKLHNRVESMAYLVLVSSQLG